MYAAGGGTTNWPRIADRSSGWRDGFADVSGHASGCGGTSQKGESASYVSWVSRGEGSRWPRAAGELGIWPGPAACKARSRTTLSAVTASSCHRIWRVVKALVSTAGCGKPHVRWCGRVPGRNPRHPTRSRSTGRLLCWWFVHGTLLHPHEPQTGDCRAGAYGGLPGGGDVRHVAGGPAARHELAGFGVGDDGGVRREIGRA